MAQMGDTVVLATANVKEVSNDASYHMLGVEYLEKMYASGRISGSRFVKRDRFPSDDATLKARIIDRTIRPRFPNDYRDEVSVIVKVLSFDPQYDPLVLGANAVSAALMISPATFNGPVSLVRVTKDEDNKLSPLNIHIDRDNAYDTDLNMVLGGDGETLVNIDTNSKEVSEEKMIEAMEYGLELMQPWLEAQKKFADLVGEVEKREYESFAIPKDLMKKVSESFGEEIAGNLMSESRRSNADKTKKKMYEEFSGDYSKREIGEAYEEYAKKETRRLVLEDGKRIDGRGFDEIRPLDTKVGLLPKVHGSGRFTRGMTQVLTIATLGSSRKKQIIDDMTGEEDRRYFHYYVEAPFVFGDAGRVRHIPGRRAVGHGALAEKALVPVLPSMEEFPYTILLMSEVMSEEGSSSMASTCGSTLALMDAGVPIKKPVAGIAIGVIYDQETGEYETLADMAGVEDFYGFMDFKVTGTRDGVTAIQMDTKSEGLPIEIFKAGFEKAKKIRVKLIDEIEDTISEPRKKVSEEALKIETVKIPEKKIGELIGPGGKMIKSIQEENCVEMDVEEDGTVNIYSQSAPDIAKAKEIVESFAFVPEVGKVYKGTVESVVDFGAFVEIKRGVSGLLHVSEMSNGFVKDVNKYAKEGEEMDVKVIGVDDEGKIKLSRKGIPGSEVDKKKEGSRKKKKGGSQWYE